MSPPSNGTGVQIISSNPRSPAVDLDNAAAETGRTINCRTDNTGNPCGSANSTGTAPRPTGASRTRTRAAPLACKHTPCHENGNIVCCSPSTIPHACNAASNTAG
ncbi:Uncharacterised protein [Mycobacterium tuberculosis]|nr:Uncharacterised protein [Mycobacterium tuberculosis]